MKSKKFLILSICLLLNSCAYYNKVQFYTGIETATFRARIELNLQDRVDTEVEKLQLALAKMEIQNAKNNR